MATAFAVGVTYDVVTPESAEIGDFDETGWTQETEPLSLRDTLDVIRKHGPYEIEHTWDGIRLTESDGSNDYRTGSNTRETVHIAASERNIARLLRVIPKGTY